MVWTLEGRRVVNTCEPIWLQYESDEASVALCRLQTSLAPTSFTLRWKISSFLVNFSFLWSSSPFVEKSRITLQVLLKCCPLRLLPAGLPGVQPTEHPGGHGQHGRHGPAVGRAERRAGFHSDGETCCPPSTSRHSGSLIDFIFLRFLAVAHVHLLLTH